MSACIKLRGCSALMTLVGLHDLKKKVNFKKNRSGKFPNLQREETEYTTNKQINLIHN